MREPVIRLGRDVLRLQEPTAEGLARDIPAVEPEALQTALESLVADDAWPTPLRRVHIVLSRDVGQLRILTGLPPVGTRALGELVSTQHARYFRCAAGISLCTAARWLAPDASGTRAEAVAADATTLNAVTSAARSAGLELRSITVDGSDLTLRGPADAAARRRQLLRHARGMLLANAVLWATALGIHCVRLARQDAALAVALSQLEGPSRSLRRVRDELRRASGSISAMREARARQRATRQHMAQLATALPDSAYISELSLDATGVGFVTGVTRDAAAAVAALERRLPHAVLLQGEPAPDPSDPGWERFSVRIGARQ